MKNIILLITLVSNIACASIETTKYPTHWWEKVPESQRQGSWEILPHEAKKGELILSKRNELGIFSNLGYSPFTFEGENFASIESLWQMMKYPDPKDKDDKRNEFVKEYPYSRSAVYLLHGFEAKRAGDAANKINKKNGTLNVSYKGIHFDYKDHAKGSKLHYKIMKGAIKAKVMQNPKILKLLLSTKGLKLLPDHKQGKNKPKSYLYHKILMDIRDAKISQK